MLTFLFELNDLSWKKEKNPSIFLNHKIYSFAISIRSWKHITENFVSLEHRLKQLKELLHFSIQSKNFVLCIFLLHPTAQHFELEMSTTELIQSASVLSYNWYKGQFIIAEISYFILFCPKTEIDEHKIKITLNCKILGIMLYC